MTLTSLYRRPEKTCLTKRLNIAGMIQIQEPDLYNRNLETIRENGKPEFRAATLP